MERMSDDLPVPSGRSVCPIHKRKTFDCQDEFVRNRLTREEIERCLRASAEP